jgi:hypothetical protein
MINSDMAELKAGTALLHLRLEHPEHPGAAEGDVEDLGNREEIN